MESIRINTGQRHGCLCVLSQAIAQWRIRRHLRGLKGLPQGHAGERTQQSPHRRNKDSTVQARHTEPAPASQFHTTPYNSLQDPHTAQRRDRRKGQLPTGATRHRPAHTRHGTHGTAQGQEQRRARNTRRISTQHSTSSPLSLLSLHQQISIIQSVYQVRPARFCLSY